ncbi:glycosyltransferase family 2 protein [Flavobacterium chungbukense]|uniref:Glycosyltransferase family 2 protein n=1 Tax=Flavobacterium chungbukense TaxID=877464 RepID=A0ABP7XL13_9FLAO|nr:glycosyltransferase family 2 protein [Flavobacterium chungbukense]MCC4922940.1 glycosyltransferase [Flavobacterium chungbukense]
MNKYSLSIITINRNNAEGLKKTIESVASQSYKDFEFIIIDGGSTDGSQQIIIDHEKHISYWVSEKDKGIYNAMNKGISKATGDFILFLNSGDSLLEDEEILKKVVLNLQNKAVYYAPIYLENNNAIKELVEYPIMIEEKFAFTNTLCQQAVIYHLSVFDNNFFDENLKFISDWKMHFNLFKNKIAFIHFNVPFANYDVYGLTSKGETKYKAHKERLKTQFLDFPFYFFKYYGTNKRVFLRLLKMAFRIK